MNVKKYLTYSFLLTVIVFLCFMLYVQFNATGEFIKIANFYLDKCIEQCTFITQFLGNYSCGC